MAEEASLVQALAEQAARLAAQWLAERSQRAGSESGTSQAEGASSASGAQGPSTAKGTPRALRVSALSGSRVSRASETSASLKTLLESEEGRGFLADSLDSVLRPHDMPTAGTALQRLALELPSGLSSGERAVAWLEGQLGPVLPRLVVPVVRRRLRHLAEHLIIDESEALSGAKHPTVHDSSRSNLSPNPRFALRVLGQTGLDQLFSSSTAPGRTVLGEGAAERYLNRVRRLCEQSQADVTEVRVSLPSLVPGLNLWAFDDAVTRAVDRLELLVRGPASHPIIVIEVNEYGELALGVAVLKRLLSRPELLRCRAGITLPVFLPDAFDVLQDLTEWAQMRQVDGGAPIVVRLVTGEGLPNERLSSALYGWPAAPFDSSRETDINRARMLDWVLTAEHTRSMRVGVAGRSLFDLAFAWLIARERGIVDAFDLEMSLGEADSNAVSATAGSLLVSAPVVASGEVASAVPYLVHHLAGDDVTLAFGTDLGEEATFSQERARFLATVRRYASEDHPLGWAPVPHRDQDRAREWQDATATTLFHPKATVVDPAAEAENDGGLTQAVLGLQPREQWNLFGDETTDLTQLTDLSGLVPRGRRIGGGLAEFQGDADTDPLQASNRAWAKRLVARVEASDLGMAAAIASRVRDSELLDRIVESARAAGVRWGAHLGSERAAVIDRAGLALSASRDELIEVMCSELGVLLPEADPEISRTADLAHYYAVLAREIDTVQGARFVPAALTVVAPSWDYPIADAADGVLSALAAGSAVIVRAHPYARRSQAVLIDVLHRAGVPRDALLFVDVGCEEADPGIDSGAELGSDPGIGLGGAEPASGATVESHPSGVTGAMGVTEDLRELVEVNGSGTGTPSDFDSELALRLLSEVRVDRVLLSGSRQTVQLLRRRRPEHELLAQLPAVNVATVTPSADLDQAVSGLVRSAFVRAGQVHTAAQYAILVGSVASDERFLRLLVDATSCLRVDYPSELAAQLGPLRAAPAGRQLRMLTELGRGQKWLVKPRALDDSGRLWSPGIRLNSVTVRDGIPVILWNTAGVADDSTLARRGSGSRAANSVAGSGEPAGVPVLDLVPVRKLEEAIALSNAVGGALSAVLFSLDEEEISEWCDNIQAGNLYINRSFSCPVVGRQAFGAWGRSVVGAVAKSGGPNALMPLGAWVNDAAEQSSSLHLRGLDPNVSELIEAGQSSMPYEEYDRVRRAALSDAIAQATEYGRSADVAELGVERNVLRYRPTAVSVRASDGMPLPPLLRVLAAATLSRSRFDLSVSTPLPEAVQTVLELHGVSIAQESDEEWLARLNADSAQYAPGSRIRLLALPEARADAFATARALHGSPHVVVYAGEPTASGRVELLPFYVEQTISMTNHRFGLLAPASDSLF